MAVISNQINKYEDLKVDLKMSLLRPKVCGWLFIIWHNLTTRREMIKNIMKLYKYTMCIWTRVQKQVMIDDIKTPLFNIVENVAVETNNNNDNEGTCVEVSLVTILEDSLTRVSLFTTSSNMTSVASLLDMTKKMPPSAPLSTTTSNLRVEVVTRRSNPIVHLLPILR